MPVDQWAMRQWAIGSPITRLLFWTRCAILSLSWDFTQRRAIAVNTIIYNPLCTHASDGETAMFATTRPHEQVCLICGYVARLGEHQILWANGPRHMAKPVSEAIIYNRRRQK